VLERLSAFQAPAVISASLKIDARLHSVLAEQRGLAPLMAKTAAETYHTAILDYIMEKRPFVSRTGQLENSIGWRGEGEGAIVYANAKQAIFIERGTKPHEIRPKNRKALRIPQAGGGYLFAKLVKHPGTEAKPFFFAELQAREEGMLSAMRLVLARRLGIST
jgi:hypothetical protein